MCGIYNSSAVDTGAQCGNPLYLKWLVASNEKVSKNRIETSTVFMKFNLYGLATAKKQNKKKKTQNNCQQYTMSK